MVINDEAWAQFGAVAAAIYLHHKIALDNITQGRPHCERHDHANHEPEIYDVFNFIREHELGGWTYTQAAIDNLDAEIEKEYQAGKW